MMNLLKMLFITIFISCNGSGGGSSSSSDESTDKNSPSFITSLSQISGSYNVNQQENFCQNISNGRSVSANITFEGNSFRYRTFVFYTSNCYGVHEFISTVSGTMTLLNDGTVDFVVNSEVGTVTMSSVVSTYNTIQECGISNWVYEESQDISNTDCSSFTNSNFTWDDVSVDNGVISYNLNNNSNILYKFQKKSIFNQWTKTLDSSNTIDFTGQTSLVTFVGAIKTTLSQEWLDILIAASRDTTGLVVGQEYVCSANITVNSLGSIYENLDDIGYITVNIDNIDTPLNNACLEQDNDSSVSGFNYEGDHIYYIFGNKLFINYFGNSDGGIYLDENWE